MSLNYKKSWSFFLEVKSHHLDFSSKFKSEAEVKVAEGNQFFELGCCSILAVWKIGLILLFIFLLKRNLLNLILFHNHWVFVLVELNSYDFSSCKVNPSLEIGTFELLICRVCLEIFIFEYAEVDEAVGHDSEL